MVGSTTRSASQKKDTYTAGAATMSPSAVLEIALALMNVSRSLRTLKLKPKQLRKPRNNSLQQLQLLNESTKK
jgi:hypothetical protein